MNIHNYSFKDTLRLKISSISELFLSFPRQTFGYILAFMICKFFDILFRKKGCNITKCVGGINYELDTRDLIDFRLFYFGVNEKHLVNYLRSEIADNNMILWDIGVNVGSVSFPLIKNCNNLIIHAFEPSPPVFERLKKNVSLNSFTRIHIHQIAIGQQCGKVDFFVSSTLANSGVGSLASTRNSSIIPVQVDCSTGEELIARGLFPEPSFIKIDVEGFEYEVLLGMNKFLEKAKQLQIIFEHEPYRIKERGMLQNQIVDFLIGLGYRIYQILPKEGFYGISQEILKEFQPSMLKYKCDFVALRKGSPPESI